METITERPGGHGAEAEETWPLSPAQARLLLAEQSEIAKNIFHIAEAVTFEGPLDITEAEGTFRELVARHPILRARVSGTGDSAKLLISPAIALDMGRIDLSALSAEQAEAEMNAHAEAALRTRFNLRTGPLLRVRLIRLSDSRTIIVLVVHHLIADGWSVGLLMRDFSRIYRSRCHDGSVKALPKLRTTYGEWVRDGARSGTAEQSASSLAAWRRMLQATPPTLELLTDRPRLPGKPYEPGLVSSRLAKEPWIAITLRCRKAGISSLTLLMGAFGLLLSRYSERRDLIVGTPWANRKHVSARDIVGLFVNILPIRVIIDGKKSVSAYLQSVHESLAGAFSVGEILPSQLLELEPEGQARRNSLFSTMLNYIPWDASQFEIPGIEISRFPLLNRTADYDISVYVRPDSRGAAIEFVYNRGLFDAESIEKMLLQYTGLIERLPEALDRPISEIALDTAGPAPPPAATSLLLPFEHLVHRLQSRARSGGSRPYVTDGTATLSYAAAEALSNRLARALRAQGVRPSRVVAVAAKRDHRLPVAMLAAWKAGAAVAILDLRQPVARLRELAAIVSPQVIVSFDNEADGAGLAAGGSTERVPPLPPFAEHDHGWLAGHDPEPLDLALTLQDAAIIQFTSGTTGRPKAVVTPHEPLSHFLAWHASEFDLRSSDRFSVLSGLGHDPIIRDLFTPLWVEGCAIIPREEDITSGALFHWMEQQAITVAHVTPAMAKLIAENADGKLSALRYAFFGGDLLLPQDLATFRRVAPNASSVNFYGATETPQGVVASRLDAETGRARLPIGRGIDGVALHILTPAGVRAGIGEIGEIAIETRYLARGYFGDPAAIAEKFLPSLAGDADRRIYRTGDRGRFRPDGQAEYLGRADDQIKLRGYRIDPKEVENALRRLPGVSDAVILPAQGSDGRVERLHAFVTGADPEQAAEPSIKCGLFFFADAAQDDGDGVFDLYLSAAKLADQIGLAAVWTPERHFTSVAAAYPSPSVLCAALATVTERVRLRAGSVVLPLHHPVRVAEEWSVVDNLSKGRVEISFASGWLADDFIFAPDAYADRRDVMLEGIAAVQRLWRGEAVAYRNGAGKMVDIRIKPCPVQRELPSWMTATANPATFVAAGERGLNLLTALQNQSVDELGRNIALYRHALAENGYDPASRKVAVMLHTFIGASDEEARATASVPLRRYLEGHARLRQPALGNLGLGDRAYEAADLDIVVNAALERFLANALIGSAETCALKLGNLRSLGVDEIACLIDFGISNATILENIPNIVTAMERAGATGFGNKLREALRNFLPDYMIPATVVALDKIPLTANGKVDRLRLAQMGASSRGALYAAPRSHVECVLVDIWEEAFRRERIGIDDDFFHLGGYSLLALRILEKAQSRLGTTIPVRLVFEARTIRKIAAQLETTPAASEVPRAGRLEADPSEPLPASVGQQRLWILHHVAGAASPLNVPAVVRFRGRLDEEALRRSLAAVVTRHDMLRARFAQRGGRLCQWIEPQAETPFKVERRSDFVDPGVLDRLAREEAALPFDLAVAPLVRAKLVTNGQLDHVLLLTVHHIVSDGTSLQLILAEIAGAYAAFARGESLALPPPSATYRDFVEREIQWLESEDYRATLDHWLRRLHGAHFTIDMPTDRPRQKLQSFRGATHQVALPAELGSSVEEFARVTGATSFTVMFAAFAAVIGRYASAEEVALGVAVSGRPGQELEKIVGLFANLLVFRVSLDPGLSFAKLVDQVAQTGIDALAHQGLPFGKLVEELAPDTVLDRQPLIQIVFTMTEEDAAAELGDLAYDIRIGDHISSTQFDLILSVRKSGGLIAARLDYNPDLFDEGTIRRLAVNYVTFLSSAVAKPGSSLGKLPLLGSAERARVIRDWNDTGLALPLAPLHELFLRQAAGHRDDVAVITSERSLSYGELERSSAFFAARLQALRLGPGRPMVAVIMRKGWQQVVAVLAVLRAGGAYLPIDPATPPERMRHLLVHAGAAAVLTEPAVAGSLDVPPGMPCLSVDEGGGAAARPESPAPSSTHLDDLAYVIYTSGSTGLPKGVMIDHRGAANTILDINQRFAVGPVDRVFALSSLSFDLSVYDIFGPLAVGGAIVVPDHWTSPDPQHWYELVRAAGVSVWNSVPALMEIFATHVADRGLTCLGIRLAMLSGDWIAIGLPDRIRKFARHCNVVSLGGATEASIWSIHRIIDRVEPHWTSIPYGRPLANQQFYVLDQEGESCPIGVPGELYIGGTGVALGYWHDAERTAERFSRNPFAPGRLYRTGDLGRWLPDGEIEFLGRRDFQVKIQGHRIELGEIEAALAQSPEVHLAVVNAVGEARGAKRLVAYVVAKAGKDASANALRAFLATKLPAYMVPSSFVILDALPLTPNGKVDRQALPVPQIDDAELQGYRPPESEIERLVAAIWREVLHIPRVGLDDNFFELGGDSLQAMQVVSRIRQQIGLELQLREVFERPTVAGVVAALSA